MKVVIIGSGNVATVLGRLIAKEHEVVQVVSRTLTNAKKLADQLGCSYTDKKETINTDADFYVIAVSDDVLEDVIEDLSLDDKVVVHTGGSIPKDILKNVSANYGVLYPLQSLRKDVEMSFFIPVLIDGNNEKTISVIEGFAKTISSEVLYIKDEERLKLHVAAVIASNFTNHLYALADDFCQKENLNFKLLIPLIEQTASRINEHSPKNMQTGPAIRHDTVTLYKHFHILESHPKLKSIYLKLTDSIMKFF